MNVLVTGACGQLGQMIMTQAKDSCHHFVFTDVRPLVAGTVYLDMTDEESVGKMMKDYDIQVVVNCAGYTDVAKAETEEEVAFRANAEAVAILAAAAEKSGAVLVHISTDYVFDGKAGVAYDEEAEPAPLNAYGRSKLAGEKAVIESGCRHIILRTAWLYGPHGRNFVSTILKKAEEQPLLKVVDDQIGTPTYAGDLADFILHIIEEDKLDKEGIYHFTDEGVSSWYDLAHEACELSGTLCEVVPCKTSDYPSAVARPSFSLLDKTKVKKTFGIDIPHWKDSLRFFLFG